MENFAYSELHEPDQSATLLSIPQLSPDLKDASRYSVQAVVTLVWPFSSSNRLFSLLLSEPDFRLRNQNGQIRVTFCGCCAEEVARTKVGIGDTVTLSLQGAQWTENQKIQSTPGKSLGWELQFKNQVKLKATRNGKKTAALDYLQPESPKHFALTAEPTTPALLSARLPSPILSEERWETPAFLRTKRLRSRSPVPSTYDIFAEEDGFVPGIGRKRPRFSFPNSQWRLLDESDDQAEDMVGNDENWFDSDEELLGRDADADDTAPLAEPIYKADESAESAHITSPTEDIVGDRVQFVEPDTPAQSTQIKFDDAQEIQIIEPFREETATEPDLTDTQISLVTPRLDPITSSSLPTPSPLVFTPVDSTTIFKGPSSNIPTSQLQFSHNASPLGATGLHELDTQPRSITNRNLEPNFRSAHLDMETSEVVHDGKFLQSIHRHSPSSEVTCINEFTVGQVDEPAAFDIDGPESTNKAVEDGDDLNFELTQDGLLGQSGGESTSAYRSVYDGGAEADLYGSESEGVVENETLSEVIEIDNTSPDGYRKRSPRPEEVEYDESDLEDREFSDDVEGDEDEMMSENSEQSDTGTGYEEESADEGYRETLTSRTSQRIVHPEVIVLDSDSEDEPHVTPSNTHGNDALNGTGKLSHYDDDEDEITSQDSDHMEEDRDADNDEEDAEEDEDVAPSETQAPESENTGLEQMPIREVYDLDETGYAPAEEADEHEAPPSDMDEIVSLQQDDFEGPRQLDTRKVHLTPGTTSDASSVNHDMMTREEQEDDSLLDVKEVSDEENDFDAKEEQFPVPEGQPLLQEQSTSPTGIMQRLAYRTVSPAPVPTPPSTVNDEAQYKYFESTLRSSDDYDSTPKSEMDEAKVNNNRHHRWIDGSDEQPLQDSNRQLPIEESLIHDLTDEDENTSEKLDEAILIKDHSFIRTETESHEVDEVKTPYLQVDHTSPMTVTPKSQGYITLAMLGEWLNETVDVIAVAVDVSPTGPSTTKTEENHMRLRITDVSMAGTTVIVDIVQPTEITLPRVTEGDVVLLYAFQAQTSNNCIELRSSNDSGWATISPSADLPHVTHSNVTFGERERGYVRLLQSWFQEDGAAMAADHMLQISISQEEKQPSPFSAASSDAGSLQSTSSGPVSRPRPRRKKGHRRLTIHELRDGRRYTEFGWLDSDSIHELRDGTVYAHSFDRD
ncbi:hypothetical protein EYB25_004641 [Talaromyces marneffei]|nr:hypothetical protein EYB25_004641 [Talaromyces marneffei]